MQNQDYWKGKKFSKTHKKRIKDANTGKKKSEATKIKIGKSMRKNTNSKKNKWGNPY